MKMWNEGPTTIATLAALLFASAGADAQSGRSENERERRTQEEKQYEQEQQSDRQDTQQQSDRQDTQQDARDRDQTRWRIDPAGWVAVGYDVDADGRYEFVEYVYGYDLIRARSRSEQRAMDEGRDRRVDDPSREGRQTRDDQRARNRQDERSRNRQDQRGERFAQDEDMRRSQQDRQSRNRERTFKTARLQGRAKNRPAVYHVQGTISEMKTVNMVGQDDAHVVARLETEQGRQAKVELGAQKDLRGMNLKRNDRIEVVGTIGKVNDKPMLIADRIRRDGRTFGVERSDDNDLKRFQGEIRSLRTVKYRGIDSRHMQARVQIRNRTALVDLGPRGKLQKLDLSEGDRIQFLADPVKIGGSAALRAEQVRHDGQVVNLDRSAERDRFRRTRRGQNSDEQSWNGGRQARRDTDR